MCLQQWECPQQLGGGEMSATVGGHVCDSGGNIRNSGGNVCDSGEIEYALRKLGLEIVIHNSAEITSEDTWNKMSKTH